MFTTSILFLLVALVVALSSSVVIAGSSWSQLGQSICSNSEGSLLGYDVAIAEKAGSLTLAVGSPKYTDNVRNQGKVQVYHFDDEQCLWLPFGTPIVGQQAEDRMGTKVALSCDGSILAVSGDTTDRDGSVLTGLVQVYQKGWRRRLGPTRSKANSGGRQYQFWIPTEHFLRRKHGWNWGVWVCNGLHL